jgi:hypothetical protein
MPVSPSFAVAPWFVNNPINARSAINGLLNHGDLVDHVNVEGTLTGGGSPSIAVTNFIFYMIDEEGIPYYLPTDASCFVETLPGTGAQFDGMTHCLVFEQDYTVIPDGSSLFDTLLSSVSTTAGIQHRISISTGADQSTGGTLTLNDGSSRILCKSTSTVWSGIYSANGSSVHCRNIVSLRDDAGTWRAYVNEATTLLTQTATAASGNVTAYNLGRSNQGSPINDFESGRIYYHAVWDSVLSAANAQNIITAARSTFPFFCGLDTTKPFFLCVGDSTIYGSGTNTGSTYFKYGFQLNFGEPVQWFVVGCPAEGMNDISNEFTRAIQPHLSTSWYQINLFFSGAINRIRTDTQTAASTYTEVKTFINTFLDAFPNAYGIMYSTMPRPSRNAEMEAYDRLVRADVVPYEPIGQNVSVGTGTVHTRCFYINLRGNIWIGGDGDDSTNAGSWADVEFAAFQNLTGNYDNDKIHLSGYDRTFFGQRRFWDEFDALFHHLNRYPRPANYQRAVLSRRN